MSGWPGRPDRPVTLSYWIADAQPPPTSAPPGPHSARLAVTGLGAELGGDEGGDQRGAAALFPRGVPDRRWPRPAGAGPPDRWRGARADRAVGAAGPALAVQHRRLECVCHLRRGAAAFGAGGAARLHHAAVGRAALGVAAWREGDRAPAHQPRAGPRGHRRAAGRERGWHAGGAARRGVHDRRGVELGARHRAFETPAGDAADHGADRLADAHRRVAHPLCGGAAGDGAPRLAEFLAGVWPRLQRLHRLHVLLLGLEPDRADGAGGGLVAQLAQRPTGGRTRRGGAARRAVWHAGSAGRAAHSLGGGYGDDSARARGARAVPAQRAGTAEGGVSLRWPDSCRGLR